MTRLSYLLLAGALVAAGCSEQKEETATQRVTDANVAACRARTEAIFRAQNRDLLSRRDETDTPRSASGLAGFTSRDLDRRFATMQVMQDCLQNGTAATEGGTANQGTITVGPNSAPRPTAPNPAAPNPAAPPPAE